MTMRAIIIPLILATTSPLALAVDCPGSQVTGTALTTLLSNNLVCAYKADSVPTNASRRWSEEHRTGNDLWEYARGAGHPVDPSKDVGSWNIASDVITYTYDGDGSYDRVVYLDSGTYYFCTTDATPQQDAIVYATSSLPASGANPCNW